MVYRLVRFDVLDDDYVAPESWESYLQLEAGESRKYVQQRYSGRKLPLETQSRHLETQSRVSLKSSFGASAAKTLSNKIDDVLERTTKRVGTDELSRTELHRQETRAGQLHEYTGFYATRHEDHTSNGLTRIIDTGRIPVAAEQLRNRHDPIYPATPTAGASETANAAVRGPRMAPASD